MNMIATCTVVNDDDHEAVEEIRAAARPLACYVVRSVTPDTLPGALAYLKGEAAEGQEVEGTPDVLDPATGDYWCKS